MIQKSGVVDVVCRHVAIQSNIAGEPNKNHTEFKGEHQVLHLGKKNFIHQSRGVNRLERSSAVENPEVLEDKLDVCQQHVQFWAPQHETDIGQQEQVQQNSKMIYGLKHLSDMERLSEFRTV